MSERDDCGQAKSHLARFRSAAIESFEEAVETQACVLAIEDGELSVNEARRYLKQDRRDRVGSPLAPPREYVAAARDWLSDEHQERHQDPDELITDGGEECGQASKQCEHCGDEFEEGEGVSGSGTVKESGVEKLGDGESIAIDELFEFDEAYCSMDCAVAGGGA